MSLGNTPCKEVSIFVEACKSYVFSIHVITQSGLEVDLTDTEMRFVATAGPYRNETVVLEITGIPVPDRLNGRQFQFQASDLALPPGEYAYDVTLVTINGYSIPLMKGPMEIGPNADGNISNTYYDVLANQDVIVELNGTDLVELPVLDYPQPDDGCCNELRASIADLHGYVDSRTPIRYQAGVSGGYRLMTANNADLARELDLYKSMGMTWLRIDIDWSAIEAVQGTLNWTMPDRVVTAAEARGLQILGVIAYSPSWATSVPGESHAPPTNIGQYATFCAQVADRYAGRIAAYEIWNEANHPPFWAPAPDPAAYSNMVRAAYPAIKGNDPAALVLAGAMSPQTGSLAPAEFAASCYAESIAGSLDAWSVHPYCYPAQATDTTTGSWNTFQRLPLLRAAILAAGDDVPVWLTEFGAPTGVDIGATSEQVQADQLLAGLGQAQVWPWVEGPLFFYSGRDRGTDPADREQMFGFVNYDFSDKLARPALFRGLLTGVYIPAAPPSGLIVSGEAETERYVRFQTDGEDRWVVGANLNAESGSDAGSDFVVARYADDGTWIDNPLDISRSGGGVTVGGLWVRSGGWIQNFERIEPETIPVVTGATGSNAAVESLVAALAGLGLIIDDTS